MCRKEVPSTGTAESFSGGCVSRVRVNYAPVNVRLLLVLLTSFVVLAVQMPQPAQAAVLRIPTGTWTDRRQRGVINFVSVELKTSAWSL